MGTKYYCDVCKEETWLDRDLQGVRRTFRDGKTSAWRFDICHTCAEKMFKGVKEFRTTMRVELPPK